jgi:hypothetical protein
MRSSVQLDIDAILYLLEGRTMWDSADWRAVVFVSDRSDAALRRRERCLKLAGIACAILTERRASGIYHKLCVRDEDALDAHMALRLGGFCHGVRLRKSRRTVVGTLRGMLDDAWEETALLLDRLLDLFRQSPHLLAGPTRRARVAR